MPDTGAPWNIPYVESTDLVSDWPADSLALANAIDAGLDAAGNAGIGSNVVQTFKNDVFTTTSTSFVDATGMTATITPSSAASKVLVLISLNLGFGINSGTAFVNLQRGGSNIAQPSGGTNPATFQHTFDGVNSAHTSVVYVYLDSPATTSATTYSLQVRNFSTNTLYINEFPTNSRTGTSTLTLVEVAA